MAAAVDCGEVFLTVPTSWRKFSLWRGEYLNFPGGQELIDYWAIMEADPTKAYIQDDATGFIRLNPARKLDGERGTNLKAP